MRRKMKMRLSTRSINATLKKLRDYRDSIPGKCHQLVEELAMHGVYVSATNAGEYGPYIVFHADVTDNQYGAVAILSARNAGVVIRQWQLTDGTIKEAEINPILMAEFGSGSHASDAFGRPNAQWTRLVGAGRGTFPGQTHAFEDSWMWLDMDGQWHESSGEDPAMPMFKAFEAMNSIVEETARKVFKT